MSIKICNHVKMIVSMSRVFILSKRLRELSKNGVSLNRPCELALRNLLFTNISSKLSTYSQ